MTWLNYHHLFYFREIARSGSISAAAQKLRIGQPGLSEQLKTFEDNLQVKLFDRQGKKLTITAAGQQVLEYANRIGKLGEELLHVVEEKTYSNNGLLQVGILEGIARTVSSHLVGAILATNKLRVSVQQAPATQLFRELTHWHLDVILANHQGPLNPKYELNVKKLFSSPVSLYASRTFSNRPKSKGIDLTLKCPIILPLPNTKMRHDIDHALKLANINTEVVTETSDLGLQKMLTLQGHGITALTEIAAKFMVKEGVLMKVAPLPDIEEDYYLIYQERVATHPGIKILTKQSWWKKTAKI